MIPNQDTQEAVELVRTSSDGRVRYSPEQREKVLDLFEQSGMSGKAHGFERTMPAYRGLPTHRKSRVYTKVWGQGIFSIVK